ncbi:extracellular solute-binding protein, family 5 [Magnetococcus marinus MC-1]|uniref:Extracellular solute-binding protein, family 5 n=1 Tax=Magnetococcus marinus (strain ATCC BAA-1437 / JCM 17883 / MC-1) TaxID=156889 RepID=A0L9L1_MAGMM|nr:extracellular solute-binding protein [Magnetococcus marinus]ABK44654.1 extracellular solute-binding protein, family 5 [Magnetococcus marinus MC-1]
MKKIGWLLLLTLIPMHAFADHGLSRWGDLKYPADFKHFDYVNPNAPVGGALTMWSLGGFDKMNPFTLKGEAPDMLGSLVFETLATSALDEPFSQYELLAKEVFVAEDGLSVTYRLNPAATFSDGSAVTSADVLFSLEILKSPQAHPHYSSYWRDIAKAVALDDHTVVFHFSQKNPELPLITGQLPVLSKNFFTQHPFGEASLTPPVGSGPYVVDRVDAGKTITYKRNPNYWGWQLPTQKGLYNFEKVVIKYFKDATVALEAFKAGEFDFVHVYHSKQWARDYVGAAFDQGKIIKTTLPHQNVQGMQGFVLNLRRPMFQDIRVRQALSLAFDFEWSNKNLFYDQYTRTASYFDNSELAAKDRPSPAELALLTPWKAELPASVFGPAVEPPTTSGPEGLRGNLRQAMQKLKEAGWALNPQRQLVKDGQPFVIDMVLVQASFERIMAPMVANLQKLGITLNYRTVDASLYTRRIRSFDFDMVVSSFGQSLSPGNEQYGYWHSQSADQEGSNNLLGLKNPAVDALVDAITYAKSREELLTATHALDRVLRAGYYVIPNWHIPYHRLAYYNYFEHPATLPLYYQPSSWVMSWWVKPGAQHQE